MASGSLGLDRVAGPGTRGWAPNVSATSRSSASTSYSPPRTVRLRLASVVASWLATAAWWRLRAAESTTADTATEVATYKASVRTFHPDAMLKRVQGCGEEEVEQ